MLSKFGTNNLELIKRVINAVWNGAAEILDVKILNRPFDMFEIYLSIYQQFQVILYYDRSILDIAIDEPDGNDTWLSDLTKEEVIEGFESMEPQNILHNFQVLDRYLRSKM